VKESKCEVRLPLAEWLNGWMMWHEHEEGLNEQFVSFMKRNGAPDDDAAAIVGAQRKPKYLGLRPPREFTRIRDGDAVAMGQREWRVITAGGHSRPRYWASRIASTSLRLCPVNVAICGTVASASAKRTTADPLKS
jgi:hypothetical protein